MLKQTRKGFSLVIVMIMMILATLVATALYKTLGNYQMASGANLQSESAVAAARAGVAASKAWFTYEGQQARNLLQNYFADPTKDIKINFDANYSEAANKNGQAFDVYLTDVKTDQNAGTELDVTLQIVGQGQNDSKVIVTSVLNLKGMAFQQPPVVTTTAVYTRVWGEEAMFLSGTFENQTGNISIPEGNLYVGGKWETNGTVTITKGSLVTARGQASTSIQKDVTVGKNAYFGSPIKLNGIAITVNGSAYVNSLELSAGGTLRVGHDSVNQGGDLWINTIIGGSGSASILARKNQTDGSRGSITIGKDYGFSQGALHAENDIWVLENTDISDFAVNTTAGRNIFVDVDCSDDCDKFRFNGPYGFIRSSTFSPAITSLGAGNIYLGPAYGGNAPESYVQKVDSMKATYDEFLVTGKKEVPYYLSDATRGVYAKAWTYWRDTYCPVGACSNGSQYLTASDWDAIWLAVNAADATLLKNGYLFVEFDGAGMQWANMNTPGTLEHNFVFYFKNSTPSLNQHMYANQPSSRSIWWSQNGFENLGCSGVVNGIIYAANGSVKLNATLTIKGQVLVSNGHNITDNAGGTFQYDNQVMSEISTATGLLRETGTTDAVTPPTPPPDEFKAGYTLSLLSPRLDVSVVSEVFGGTEVNPNNVVEFDRALVVEPGLISVLKDEYTVWGNTFTDAHPIRTAVRPEAGCEGVSASPINASVVQWDQEGTYIVNYTADCPSGTDPVGQVKIWVKPLSATVVSSATGTSSAALASSGATSSVAVSSSVAALPSSSAGVGIAFEFQTGSPCPTPSPGADTKIWWGAKFTNNSGSTINLKDYRVTYYLGTSTAASGWTFDPPAGNPSDAGIVNVSFGDIVPSGINPRTGYDYDVMAQVTWPYDVYVNNATFADFTDLGLRKVANTAFRAYNDYSYMGCQVTWAINDYVVFEQWDGSAWNVVAGQKPPYTVVTPSSSSGLSSSVAASSSAAAGCTSLYQAGTPTASDWVPRNDWYDQNNGTNFSNVSGSLQLNHRIDGEQYVLMVEQGHPLSVSSGSTYSVNFNFMDNATSPVSSIQVGFTSTTSDVPLFQGTPVTVSTAVNSAGYTPIHVELTPTSSGTSYLMIRIEFARKSVVLTYNLKDVSVFQGTSCGVIIPPSSSSVAMSSSVTVSSSIAGSSSAGAGCIAWVNGTSDYGSHCYNSGLANMAPGTCYTMNPDRAPSPQWINNDASQVYWWVTTPCN